MADLRSTFPLLMLPVLLPSLAAAAPVELETLFTIGRPGGLSGGAPGWFSYPVEVSADAAGRIYVGEDNNNRMQVFNAAGTFQFQVTQATINADGSGTRDRFEAVGIQPAPDGTIYVADQGNSCVMAFSPEGRWLREFGSPGVTGGLSLPTGITLVGDRLFVSDFRTSSVHGFNPTTGTNTAVFGAAATSFRSWSPSGITSDAAGQIYVTDTDNDQIHHGPPTGAARSLTSFGTAGRERGQLNDVADIAVAENGLRYVISSQAEGRIEVYLPDGTHATTLLGDTAGDPITVPTALHVQGDRLYLTDGGRHRVRVFRIVLPEIRLSAGPGRVTEDSAGVLEYQVSRTASTDTPLTVSLTSGGTATAGVDYTSEALAAGQIVIPAGERSAAIRIAITADNLAEVEEDLTIGISPGALYRSTEGAATATLAIGDDDAAPVTVEGGVRTVPENGTLTIGAEAGALAGATDKDDGPAALTAELVTGPAHGAVEFAADGSYIYRPATGYHGADEFIFRATDGTNFSAPTTVRIQVIQQVDLQLTVEASADPFLAGTSEPKWHRYRVTNAGPSTATGIRLWFNDSLYDAPGDPVPTAGTVVRSLWDIPQLLPGESAELLMPFNLPVTIRGSGTVTTEMEVDRVNEPLINFSDDFARKSTRTLSPANFIFTGVEAPPSLNRQSGLLGHQFSVQNLNLGAVSPFRLVVLGLPEGVVPVGASGTTEDGHPYFLVTEPLERNATRDLSIEFYSPVRSAAFTPTYRIDLLDSATPPPLAEGGRFEIDRHLMLADGSFMIEWTSVPGARYAVEYSADLTEWKQAGSWLPAAANRTQWIDDGPPKTDVHPSAAGNRYYRVVRLEDADR